MIEIKFKFDTVIVSDQGVVYKVFQNEILKIRSISFDLFDENICHIYYNSKLENRRYIDLIKWFSCIKDTFEIIK